jgi:HPt (histidine-containing phosphotransfer) domain-containing protein
MSEIAKFKLNLKNGEVEIEGSEEFVERQIHGLESLLELIGASNQVMDEEPESQEQIEQAESRTSTSDGMPSTFGEWLHAFKSDINDLDKALVTARYVQHESSTNDFKTSEVNKSLKDHGIKLSNPSTSLKRLIQKKYLFQTRKNGKLIYMRVSVEGQNHLETLKANG